MSDATIIPLYVRDGDRRFILCVEMTDEVANFIVKKGTSPVDKLGTLRDKLDYEILPKMEGRIKALEHHCHTVPGTMSPTYTGDVTHCEQTGPQLKAPLNAAENVPGMPACTAQEESAVHDLCKIEFRNARGSWYLYDYYARQIVAHIREGRISNIYHEDSVSPSELVNKLQDEIARLKAGLEREKLEHAADNRDSSEAWTILVNGGVRCRELSTQAAGTISYVKSLEGQCAALREELERAKSDAEGRKRFERWYAETMAERDQKTEECEHYLCENKRLAEELGLAKKELEQARRDLANQVFEGNSVSYWCDKAKAYGNTCLKALRILGNPHGLNILEAASQVVRERDNARANAEVWRSKVVWCFSENEVPEYIQGKVGENEICSEVTAQEVNELVRSLAVAHSRHETTLVLLRDLKSCRQTLDALNPEFMHRIDTILLGNY